MKAIIVGGGIGGLTTALMLRARGIDCELYEQSDSIRELGVGINTLPHAIRELAAIGLLDRLDQVAVRTHELFYLTRHGQQVWHEKRGLDAGHDVPQFSIHRGRLQGVIHQAVAERLGSDAIHAGCRLGSFTQDEGGVTAYFFDRSGAHAHTARGDILIGADGIHSKVRQTLFPEEGPPCWNGLMLWRGAADWPVFLTGRSMIIAGGLNAKAVVYPIAEGSSPASRLTNWAVLVRVGDGSAPPARREDWSRGRLHGARECNAGVLGISLLRPRPVAPLVERPRHAARRCCASDVSGGLERRVAGDPRCAMPCGCAGALRTSAAGVGGL
jgi:5-methylphenazine-1-carboxylate 1-monooxygenase